MSSSKYQQVVSEISQVLPEHQIITDYSKRFALSVDASFYRLLPELILYIDSEQELTEVLKLTAKAGLSVTFRAAGTSLSGQAQSDSILLMLTNTWRWHQILDLGMQIKLGPGVIGADANRYLLPFGRKIGPDPASIASCKIAGIAANNSSGMCCGVKQNSYHTLANMRLVLADGTVLDTEDEQSVAKFRSSHQSLLAELERLSSTAKQDVKLKQLIQQKYRLKNTTGYGINALIDFSDPIDILCHLMIGSEGTLGFISNITFNTVPEHKHKSTSLILFANVESCCQAVTALALEEVDAVELLDQRALLAIKDLEGIPEFVKDPAQGVAALLVETRAGNSPKLQAQVEKLQGVIQQYKPIEQVPFTSNKKQSELLWKIRKQTFPAVGAMREIGTTVIIEDVAFPVENLAQGVSALQNLFNKYEYHEAIIFGHALDGNLHFVFTQDFATNKQVERYKAFMDDVCILVAIDFKGSLKAEHGTGRNMAPFVELEWGEKAYQLMRQIKVIFDPQNVLNPGVIINDDINAHIVNLKPLPASDDIVDRCIECGFCESACPSNGLTLTPRQRITSFREISRLRQTNESPKQLKQLEKDFQYLAIDTCAATGLCAQECPVNINTGDLIRKLRSKKNAKFQRVAKVLGKNFKALETLSRFGLSFLSKLKTQNTIHKLLPNSISMLPNATDPKMYKRRTLNKSKHSESNPLKVVYFPSCSSRVFGEQNPQTDETNMSLSEVTQALLSKSGCEVINVDFTGHCCGMPFNSKGLFEQAQVQASNLEQQLLSLSNNGQYPILFDTSPCKSMLEQLSTNQNLTIFEPVGFIEKYLVERLSFIPKEQSVMLHITCSSRKMDLAEPMYRLAKRCVTDVVVPEFIGCCGFAGDKGILQPELNQHALMELKQQIPNDCKGGYSNSRTCELGLTHHSGIDYKSIIYLVNDATETKALNDRK